MDRETAAQLRGQLITRGSVMLPTRDGKRLYVVHSSVLGDPAQSLLIAYEGGGVMVWDYASDPRYLNRFRLRSEGFTLDVAEAVAMLLEGLVPDGRGGLSEENASA